MSFDGIAGWEAVQKSFEHRHCCYVLLDAKELQFHDSGSVELLSQDAPFKEETDCRSQAQARSQETTRNQGGIIDFSRGYVQG